MAVAVDVGETLAPTGCGRPARDRPTRDGLAGGHLCRRGAGGVARAARRAEERGAHERTSDHDAERGHQTPAAPPGLIGPSAPAAPPGFIGSPTPAALRGLSGSPTPATPPTPAAAGPTHPGPARRSRVVGPRGRAAQRRGDLGGRRRRGDAAGDPSKRRHRRPAAATTTAATTTTVVEGAVELLVEERRERRDVVGGGRVAAVGPATVAEPAHHGATVGRDHDVVGRQAPVGDAPPVERVEGARQVGDEGPEPAGGQPAGGEGAGPGEPRAQLEHGRAGGAVAGFGRLAQPEELHHPVVACGRQSGGGRPEPGGRGEVARVDAPDRDQLSVLRHHHRARLHGRGG